MIQVIDGYISELEKHLTNLPKSDREEVLEFYHEFLLDGDFVRRSTIEQELGTPKQLAIKILADYAVTDEQTQTHQQRASLSNVKTIWYILLGICAAPLGIPLVIAALGAVLFTICLCFGLFVAAVAIVLALLTLLGATLFKSIHLLSTGNWAVGCFYIGTILIGLAIVLFTSPLIVRLINLLIAECAKLMRSIGKKAFKNNYYQSTTDKYKEK